MIIICFKNDNLAFFSIIRLMIEYEIIKHDKLKDIRVFINSIRFRSLHTHHDIELLLVIDGKGTINIKGKNHHICKGDMVLVNSFDNHEIISVDSLQVIIIQFSNNFLNEYYHNLKNTIFLDVLPREKYSQDDYRDLVNSIMDLTKQYLRSDRLFELNCVKTLIDILYSLFKHTDNQTISEDDYNKRKKLNRRMDRISSYIDIHYQEPIRLSEIAEIEKISVTHLSHFITNNFGMTFQTYLNDKRLESALRMISNESLTLSQIAVNSGFSELKYMTKAFKQTFGLTPKQYRQEGFIDLPVNKKANVSEYIYSDTESLEIINKIAVNKLLE